MINPTTLDASSSNAMSQAVANTSGDFNKTEFLQLLVTQLQNQNPLSPMEGQEFASQLAQFTSVEQLTSINDNIMEGTNADLILTQSVNNTLAANFVGKEVTSLGNTVTLVSGDSPSISFVLNDYADKVNLNIYDDAGNLVRTIKTTGLESGIQSLQWDGLGEDGAELAGGNYTFEVEALSEDNDQIGVTELTKGIVSTVRYTDGMAVLIVNGNEVALADVLEIG